MALLEESRRSTDATSSSSDGGGRGTTGFLFGNIDNRGRLEEDYLSDDAKDCIDNIGTTVAEQNEDLEEIVKKTKGNKYAVLSDNEKYDDGGRTSEENGVDYYNEGDVDMDEEEQTEMARKVLENKKIDGIAGSEDDENYDEEEEEIKGANRTVAEDERVTGRAVDAVNALAGDEIQTCPGSILKLSPNGVSAESGKVPMAKLSSEMPVKPADIALEEQRKLMRAAREGMVETVVEKKSFFPEDQPLKFSELFAEAPKKLRVIPKRRRKRYGVALQSKDKLQVSMDERELLNSKEIHRSVDPVALFVSTDPVVRTPFEEERIHGRQILEEVQQSPTVLIESESDRRDFEEAAQPLSKSAKPLPPLEEPEAAHSMLQQSSWEEDIRWHGSDGNDDQDEEDDYSDVKLERPGELPTSEEPVTVGREEEEDSDEDMDWEDGNVKVNPSVQESIAVNPATENASLTKEAHGVQNATQSAAGPVQPTVNRSILITPSLNSTAQPSKDASINSKSGSSALNPKPKSVSFAPNTRFDSGNADIERTDHDRGQQSIPFKDFNPSSLIRTPLTENRDLSEGAWLMDVIWDSDTEGVSETPEDRLTRQYSKLSVQRKENLKSRIRLKAASCAHRFDGLILDPNDPHMDFIWLDSNGISSSSEIDSSGLEGGFGETRTLKSRDSKAFRRAGGAALATPVGSARLSAKLDPFNISLDKYYRAPSSTHTKALGQTSVLKTLRHAPPALKAQTSPPVLSEDALRYFHRPSVSFAEERTLVPLRRKRPKSGLIQVAGLKPKKKAELSCGNKDPYRVTLFEYGLEKEPPLLAIPGMASRLVTYHRASSAGKKQELITKSAGTDDAETVYLAPYEPPPLHCGDLAVDQSMTVLESRLFGAPCVIERETTDDFLIVRRGADSFVRVIDSVVSVGIAEPRVEVMPPNTDRFKKYSRDRITLWIIRHFMNEQRKIPPTPGPIPKKVEPPSLDKDKLKEVFSRKRTFPETSVIKILKELAKYQGHRYIMNEPVKGFPALERELLRTINPEETAAFEAMDSGWEGLIHAGINSFTHPSSQGNILLAAERTAMKDAPAIGLMIRKKLLRAPWYRTQVLMAGQKHQEKELIAALKMARIMNDLREGGEVKEARMRSLTSLQASQILCSEFRVYTKKIPTDLSGRKQMIRDCLENKIKLSTLGGSGKPRNRGKVRYKDVINSVLTRQRAAGRGGTGLGVTAIVAAGCAMMVPLDVQLRALRGESCDGLPNEEERTRLGDAATSTVSKSASSQNAEEILKRRSVLSGKRGRVPVKPKASVASDPSKTSKGKGHVVSFKSKKKKVGTVSSTKRPAADEEEAERKELELLMSSSIGRDAPGLPGHPAEVQSASNEKVSTKKKKKRRRIKIVKKVTDPVTKEAKTIVSYVEDPAEIAQIMAKRSVQRGDTKMVDTEEVSGTRGQNSGKLKISINMNRLNKQGKSIKKKRKLLGGVSSEKNNSSGKRTRGGGNEGSGNVKESEPVVELKVGEGEGAQDKKAKRERAKGSGGVRKIGGKKQIGKIKIDTKKLQEHKEDLAAKRRRAQYGEDLKYPRKRPKKSGLSSRRKRNGVVLLNSILEDIEKSVRGAQGYIVVYQPKLTVARLREGEVVPFGAPPATSLARPKNTGLDFTVPVDPRTTPRYREVIKKPMYLDLIKHKAKRMQYKCARDFMDDMDLLVHNARLFNSSPDVEWVVQHAELLREVATEEMKSRADEIQAAEDTIRKEKAEMARTSQISRSMGPPQALSESGIQSLGPTTPMTPVTPSIATSPTAGETPLASPSSQDPLPFVDGSPGGSSLQVFPPAEPALSPFEQARSEGTATSDDRFNRT